MIPNHYDRIRTLYFNADIGMKHYANPLMDAINQGKIVLMEKDGHILTPAEGSELDGFEIYLPQVLHNTETKIDK